MGRSAVLTDALARQHAPLAGIWGARDHAVQGATDRVADTLRRIDPACRFQVIPDAGHWVMYEATDAFNAALRACLEAVPA